MLLKTDITPDQLRRRMGVLAGAAQMAFVAGIILNRLDMKGFDFLEGVLLGFSMVGNLAYIYYTSRKGRKND